MPLRDGVELAVPGFGENVYFPTQEFGGQFDVLPLAADGQGELIVGADHFQGLFLIVHGDPGDHGRGQGVLRIHGDVRGPDNDVDALALELLDHVLDAGTADAHAGADRDPRRGRGT